ncbi:MAG: RNB domain-containing ribonuclease [Spirochaetaceae bacterium]|jgi:exoribonuclease-2|nr:RNB domain-containing ribonuclease [Spirochaetaceae bacterium]
MIREKSLVAYKNRPALVVEAGEKITITVSGADALKVRKKDIEPLHPGPCTLFGLDQEQDSGDPRSAWELLEENTVSLKELAELVYGEYTPRSAWLAYLLLKDGLYFTGGPAAVRGRSPEEVQQGEQRRLGRQHDKTERDAFLNRLKSRALRLPEDRRFLQDIEALAYGKTDKSRTLKELGKGETPQDAHRLLLDAGVWGLEINPHPSRFGLSMVSAKTAVPPPPWEERLDLTSLNAFAIDNPWSGDPDDAISLEGGHIWVHVADPASVIMPGSPSDLEARDRGATLYLPEGPSRMLSGEALPLFALGLQETSPALSFKIALAEDFSIKDCETAIVRSWVRVTRLSYTEADEVMDREPDGDLGRLSALAAGVQDRRMRNGAVMIELPETHIFVTDGRVTVEPLTISRSAQVVRECMLLAGEGAARWALARRLPFPYISQEIGDIPDSPPAGMAGSFQIRRCMRPRTLSVKPGLHWGLGLDAYTQVTSPLRRYTDLLAHQQIRAFLRQEALLREDEIVLRLGAGEAAAYTAMQAERASRNHWLAVYLSDKKESQWDAVALESRGPRSAVMIPALGIETLVACKHNLEPNEQLTLALSSVRIPEGEAVFIPVGPKA